MVSQKYEQIECKTVDGTIIRGLFFAVDGPAPIIVMSHGVSPLTMEYVSRRS
jgi:hypothetical protein